MSTDFNEVVRELYLKQHAIERQLHDLAVEEIKRLGREFAPADATVAVGRDGDYGLPVLIGVYGPDGETEIELTLDQECALDDAIGFLDFESDQYGLDVKL